MAPCRIHFLKQAENSRFSIVACLFTLVAYFFARFTLALSSLEEFAHVQ